MASKKNNSKKSTKIKSVKRAPSKKSKNIEQPATTTTVDNVTNITNTVTVSEVSTGVYTISTSEPTTSTTQIDQITSAETPISSSIDNPFIASSTQDTCCASSNSCDCHKEELRSENASIDNMNLSRSNDNVFLYVVVAFIVAIGALLLVI